ncbi:helix-turn-helix domain-containing protein [Nesterenkonia populi]|uniref:helix-turn-helix domain-containing protein n=1 Tax=Nesterenkonia populi TaxID=1591087 RepID=UPI0011BE4270|nr:helix-turn-helix transcriptional regulator [Nesterenkonia populi]
MAQKPSGPPGLLSRGLTSEIKAELGRQSLSQTELGRRIGKSKGYVSQRLLNDAQWLTNDIEDVAEALNMDASELLDKALSLRSRWMEEALPDPDYAVPPEHIVKVSG